MKHMAHATMRFLSRQDIERIHAMTMRVLEQVGVAIHSDAVREMLVKAGAERSKDGKRILLPEAMVKSAIASAPKSMVLASRDRQWDMKVPTDGRTYMANGGEGIFVKDMITGEQRYSTADDVRDFTIFANELPQVDFWWQMVGATEQPNHLKYLLELKLGFEYTVKHIQAMAGGAQEARRSIEMASILSGDEEELRRRPIISACLCPISPLTFEGGLSEAQAEFARAGIPVVAMVAAVAGLTAPVTLAGAITQVNAENLASLTITQVASKGAPWIYSSDTSAGNLRTGSINYRAFETYLLRAGQSQMGRHYGLPTMLAGVSLEDVSLSIGSIEEGVPYMVVQGMVDSDFGSGFGGVDEAAGASYEQYLLDTWVWEAAKGFVREFETDEAAISFETIAAAALDMNFLGKRHTISRFKKEFFDTTHPEATIGGPKDVRPRGELIKKAYEETKKMLSGPKKLVVSRDESERMGRIIKDLK